MVVFVAVSDRPVLVEYSLCLLSLHGCTFSIANDVSVTSKVLLVTTGVATS